MEHTTTTPLEDAERRFNLGHEMLENLQSKIEDPEERQKHLFSPQLGEDNKFLTMLLRASEEAVEATNGLLEQIHEVIVGKPVKKKATETAEVLRMAKYYETRTKIVREMREKLSRKTSMYYGDKMQKEMDDQKKIMETQIQDRKGKGVVMHGNVGNDGHGYGDEMNTNIATTSTSTNTNANANTNIPTGDGGDIHPRQSGPTNPIIIPTLRLTVPEDSGPILPPRRSPVVTPTTYVSPSRPNQGQYNGRHSIISTTPTHNTTHTTTHTTHTTPTRTTPVRTTTPITTTTTTTSRSRSGSGIIGASGSASGSGINIPATIIPTTPTTSDTDMERMRQLNKDLATWYDDVFEYRVCITAFKREVERVWDENF